VPRLWSSIIWYWSTGVISMAGKVIFGPGGK